MAINVMQYWKALCIQHVFKDIWEEAVGETVVYVLEPGNIHDRNTIADEKDGKIISHLPWKVS